MLIVSYQDRLCKLVVFLLTNGIICSSGLIALSLKVLSHIDGVFGSRWLFKWKVLWNEWNVTHWLSNWLLFTHLHLSFWLICILNRSIVSYRPCHLASIRWRIVITHLRRLGAWLSLHHPVFWILAIDHFEVNSGHLKILLGLVDMLLVLLNLLLLHLDS